MDKIMEINLFLRKGKKATKLAKIDTTKAINNQTRYSCI